MTKRAERGVYLVVHNSGKVQYAGRSGSSITTRFERDHIPNGRFHPGIERVERFGIRNEERRNNVEARLIKTLDPPRNKKTEPISGGIAERVGSWLDTRRIIAKVGR
jgi:hypothetical protein